MSGHFSLKSKVSWKFTILGISLLILFTVQSTASGAVSFVTDKSSVTVPENKTATFRVKLSARPSSTVTATVSRVEGDKDIVVQKGSSLSFTRSNWYRYQTVTLFAAEDADGANGTATIGISAKGITRKTVNAIESDNDDILIVTDVNSVSVPEGGTGTFKVKLSINPSTQLTVSVKKTSGDVDISIQSGSNLIFNSSNWNIYQTVTLAAADDPDTINGSATISLSAQGAVGKTVTATESDKGDVLIVTDVNSVTVPEGGTATFEVKLSIKPSSQISVSVERSSGDADISVSSGSNLIFDPLNWNSYQTVTLAAADDPDGANGNATISLSAIGAIGKDISATESDDETINVTAPNGGENWFQGSTHEITWLGSVDVVSNVKIELYRGGTLDSVVIPSTPDDGSFSWIIPDDQATGSNFKIKITYLSDNTIFDESDDPFTILDSGYDGDGDGVPDREEMGPDGNDPGYDGNVDGTPDGEQDNVASLHSVDGNHYVTLENPLNLTGVKAVSPPPGVPQDVSFPYGFFEFSITGLTPGGATFVKIYLDGENPDIYYKFGMTPGGSADEVYEFLYDPETVTGAEFDGFMVTLHFVDGKLGDDDITANGTVTDQGGPGMSSLDSPQSLGKDCFIATAAFGSIDAPRVEILREFRDRILVRNSAGRWFVDQYYRYSPPIARWLEKHEGARIIVRFSLIPVVFIAHMMLNFGVATTLLFLIIFSWGSLMLFVSPQGAKRVKTKS